MHSAPLQLPCKVSEASTLAGLILQHAEGRKLDNDLRSRLGVRMQTARFSSMTPFPGSLQRDPIHPSTYYVAIDAQGNASWLLRIALATSPSSGLFPRAVLIGRMRTNIGHEVVVNAIRFAPTDTENIRTFVEQVDRAFLPRPQGASRTIAVTQQPLDQVFEAYSEILRIKAVNVAAVPVADDAGFHTALWTVIRAGWREGFTIETDVESVAQAPAGCTKFAVRMGERLEEVEAIYERLQARAGRRIDFELVFPPEKNSPDEISRSLEYLGTRGRPVQFAGSEPSEPTDSTGILRRSIGPSGRVSYRISNLKAIWDLL